LEMEARLYKKRIRRHWAAEDG